MTKQTYSEKLRDPRWLVFRDDYIERKSRHTSSPQCEDCGEDTDAPLHVHHRRYYEGREPWEYADEDLRLLCKFCHERIHRAEQRARNFIRTIPAHCAYEMDELFAELSKSHHLKAALAKAYHLVSDFNSLHLGQD